MNDKSKLKSLINPDNYTIGIIGSGQMGRGIAEVTIRSGIKCKLFDINNKALDKALKKTKSAIEKYPSKNCASSGIEPLELLSTTDKIIDLKNCDVVIEAASESIEIKSKIFNNIDLILDKESLILSNTSSISITLLASTTSRSSKVCGMHFMNPVPRMKLVEIIRGLQTSDETYEEVLELTKILGKTPVTAPDSEGFIVNRILAPMINEAFYLLQEGTSAEDINTAMKLGTGHPMGPLELADYIGLDTLLAILEIMHDKLGSERYRPCPLIRNYVRAGWLGNKTGKGVMG